MNCPVVALTKYTLSPSLSVVSSKAVYLGYLLLFQEPKGID